MVCMTSDADAGWIDVGFSRPFVADAFISDASSADAFFADASISDDFIPDASSADAFLTDASAADACVSGTCVSDASIADDFFTDASAPDACVADDDFLLSSSLGRSLVSQGMFIEMRVVVLLKASTVENRFTEGLLNVFESATPCVF